MTQSIYGLHADYVQTNGTYLVITRGNPIRASDLNDVQVKMLQANPIPVLLPIHFEEMDFEIFLRYDITGKKLLSQVVKTERLTAHQFLLLLLRMMTALEDSMNYMLSERNYVLNDDFIFVGSHMEELYFTYLPLEEIETKPPVQEELKALITQLLTYVEDLKGITLQRVMNHLESSAFSISGFKAQISSMLTNQPLSIPKLQPIVHDEAEVKAESYLPSAEIQPALPSKLDSLPSKVNTYLILGGMLPIALMWKAYMDNSSEGMLYISLGVTLLIADSIFVFMKVWRPGMPLQLNALLPKKADVQPVQASDSVQEAASASEGIEDIDQYYQRLEQHTTLLSNYGKDATVLLNEFEHGPIEHKPEPYLEVSRQGNTAKIPIETESFLIGRISDAVQYLYDEKGVSRTHLEIISNMQGYMAKDLGSKNGSLLNKEKMTAYKLYPLDHGDQIKIVNCQFTFILE
jgi:hypothetical protein